MDNDDFAQLAALRDYRVTPSRIVLKIHYHWGAIVYTNYANSDDAKAFIRRMFAFTGHWRVSPSGAWVADNPPLKCSYEISRE